MRVLVAGAGIAGLETLVGLRALAGERVELTLLAPVDSFAYRPLSTAAPFTFRAERRLSIASLAEGIDAAFVRDGLSNVEPDRGRVLTGNGDFIPYDALVLAMGAHHSTKPSQGWQWTRGPGGPPLFARLLKEIESGEARRVAFVVPAGAAWPVDAYELALIATRATRHAHGGEVILLTAEQDPLEALGHAASEAVRNELADAGVELRTGVEIADTLEQREAGRDAFSAVVARVTRARGRSRKAHRTILNLSAGEPLRVDRVVALPTARGPAVGGVTHDAHGFVPVDEQARVSGGRRAFAVGDATTARLKHSLLATGQANTAAETLAAEAGADINPTPWSQTLYGILAVPPHFPGSPDSTWLDNGEPITRCLWWPPGHVTGRHLAPYVAARDPVVRTGLLWHPPGVPVAAQVAGPTTTEHPPSGSGPSTNAIESDARSRQLLAIRRTQRAGERLQHTLEAEGEAFERREREVIARLEAAGYLRHDQDDEVGRP